MSSKKSKAKPVDRAVPTIRKPKGTDAAKVATTRSVTTAMKASNLYAAHPTLQVAADAWNTAADAVDAIRVVVDDLKGKLATAQATQRTNRRNWTDAMKHVVTTVAVVTQGSADDVHGLGLDVRTHATPGLLPAPSGLTATPSKVAGEVIMKWAIGNAHHGFIVQRATDVANQATYSLPIPCTKAKLKLNGLGGAIVHVRVAAIDPASPSGQSPYSDWVVASA